MEKNVIKTKEINTPEKFGKRIRSLRKKYNLTQEELAYKINMSARNLSDIENGRVNCHYTTICFLAEAFDISLKELFTEEE
ncbi:MAG: helix-turn-helix domain-containing protein [Anaeroplasma sp.]